MRRRPTVTRFIALLAMLVLWVQGAVPLLAASAAGLQSRPVAEVCSVWGVKTVRLHDAGAAHAADHTLRAQAPQSHAAQRGYKPHDHAAHEQASYGPAAAVDEPAGSHGDGEGANHCALLSLAAMGSLSEPLPAPLPVPAVAHCASCAVQRAEFADAVAAWTARRKQGPPTT